MLSLYRRLLRLRRDEVALSVGPSSWSRVSRVLIFRRHHLRQSLAIALNFDGEDKELPPEVAAAPRLLSSAADGAENRPETQRLRGNEGIVVVWPPAD
jgi:hypothetical protein